MGAEAAIIYLAGRGNIEIEQMTWQKPRRQKLSAADDIQQSFNSISIPH
jgi:hypothetical protein